jgi:hypothetical protein
MGANGLMFIVLKTINIIRLAPYNIYVDIFLSIFINKIEINKIYKT